MRLYHRTPAAEAILAEGFKDHSRAGRLGDIAGVWLSEWPLDRNEGAKGDILLSLEIPDAVLAEYEVIEDEDPADGIEFPDIDNDAHWKPAAEKKPYREFVVPAAVVNQHGPVLLCDAPWYRHLVQVVENVLFKSELITLDHDSATGSLYYRSCSGYLIRVSHHLPSEHGSGGFCVILKEGMADQEAEREARAAIAWVEEAEDEEDRLLESDDDDAE